MHFRHGEDHKSEVHRMQSIFALVASITLAGLIVVAPFMTMARLELASNGLGHAYLGAFRC
jgi:hypothetical protein